MVHVVEVCCDGVESVKRACEGGAHRIELCQCLAVGGLTPSAGTVVQACKLASIPVNVLIRPREGDFVFTEDEVLVMLEEIKHAKQAGAHGVVIGCLTNDGRVDVHTTQRLARAAQPMQVTFHRAIDQSCDCEASFTQLLAIPEITRVLTSGGQANATQGASTIQKLVQLAAVHNANNPHHTMVVMAGAGVSETNALDIIKATAVTEIHGSFRSAIQSSGDFKFCEAGSSARMQTDPTRVRACVEAIKSL